MRISPHKLNGVNINFRVFMRLATIPMRVKLAITNFIQFSNSPPFFQLDRLGKGPMSYFAQLHSSFDLHNVSYIVTKIV